MPPPSSRAGAAGGDPPGVRPGALSALLEDIARGTADATGAAWDRALRAGAVFGRYELVREVGRGGFGVVYEAKDLSLGRMVAFKAVRAGRDPGVREELLLREAEAAARLSHPNIVTLYDVGRSEHGPFLVLELLRGRNLAQRLDDGPVTLQEALRVGVEVAKGLAHAHDHGVVHRDLTPGNIYLCDDGQVKVLDLGLAHAFGRSRIRGGTSAYMAPEQAADAPEDERTDVFALGVILYRTLTGELPFRDDIVGRAAAPGLEVPAMPAVGALVGRMLERDPVKRPRSGGEVAAALSALQRELERSPSEPSQVRTRPHSRMAGRLAELRWGAGTRDVGEARAGEPRTRGMRLALAIAGVAFLAATVAVGAHVLRRGAQQPAQPVAVPSIAVLPFADMSPRQDQEYLSDGLAEEIRSALSRVEGLRVAGRTSSFHFKGSAAKLADIGRELNVGALLEGGVRRDGKRIRVTASLLNAADGFQTWSDSYDRDLGDILGVEREIAGAVAEALQARLLRGRPQAPEPARSDPEAHLQLLIARSHMSRGSPSDFGLAVDAYRRALSLEPGLSQAWAGLAFALAYHAEQLDTLDELLAEKRAALRAAERAVATGPGVAEAYRARGVYRAVIRHEWREGLADLDRAVALEPNDAENHLWRGHVLAALGSLAEATAAIHRSIDLEPLSAFAWVRLAMLQAAAGQLEAAKESLQRALSIAPDNAFAAGFLEQAHVLEGRPQDALAVARQFKRWSSREQWGLMAAALAHHSLGHPTESRRALEDLERHYGHMMAFQLAEVCAWRGDRDGAFRWLDLAAERLDGGVYMTKFSPFLRSLRADPRYAAFLRKVNLPAE
jgi:eukaryotic-like serine/threonine-protein kinase